jgi:hypothetical protein
MKLIFDGEEYWHDDNMKLHRDDGPAVVGRNGYFAYFQHGKRHRLDGPAVHDSLRENWYINGIEYTKEEFLRIVKLKELL